MAVPSSVKRIAPKTVSSLPTGISLKPVQLHSHLLNALCYSSVSVGEHTWFWEFAFTRSTCIMGRQAFLLTTGNIFRLPLLILFLLFYFISSFASNVPSSPPVSVPVAPIRIISLSFLFHIPHCHSICKKLALTLPTSGGRSVGIVR
jgi:hypothetical protein